MISATVVLVPLDVEDIQDEVARRLAPFDSALSGNEVEKACECVGQQAWLEADSIANGIAPRKEMREQFTREHLEQQMRLNYLGARYWPLTPEEKQEYLQIKDELDQLWDLARRPFRQAYRSALENHPLKDKPDPNCKICGGSGHLTCLNAQGKYTSWTIGGRYSGFFDPDYDPRRDPDNLNICELCGGSGNRPEFAFYILDTSQVASAKVDENGNEIPGTRIPNWPLPEGAERRPWCNACGGTGRSPKPSAEWVGHESTIALVASLPADSPLTEAVVTPDGQWFQCPDETGLDYDEKKAALREWESLYRRLLAEHSNCLAVACEVH